MVFREYYINIIFNGIRFNKLVISDHFEAKHDDHIDDLDIKGLVELLDEDFRPLGELDEGFYYIALEGLLIEARPYRLVLCLPEDYEYIGVINAFRVKESKK